MGGVPDVRADARGPERLLRDHYATLRTGTTRVSDTAYHFIMFDEPRWLIAETTGFLASVR